MVKLSDPSLHPDPHQKGMGSICYQPTVEPQGVIDSVPSGDKQQRQELQEALCRYTTGTLTYINTVRGFCEGISSWKDVRTKDLSKLEEIKDKADKVELSFSHVTQSKSKKKGMWEYVKNTVTSEYDDSRRAELQRELAAVLEVILKGLKKLDHFLEAVEKLAVTSLHVFMEENQVIHLPKGISLEHVQVVIIAARLICPLLLEFKRDASDFFLPKLQIVEVLSDQLHNYIETTRMICEDLEKSSFNCLHFSQRLQMTKKHLADLGGNLAEDDIQRIVCHINQHFELRMDQNFRLVFLFQDVSHSGFIDKFKERRPRMQQFLTDLEERAVQLDRMNKGAKISRVTGSSVGAAGGVISIVGLALIPVTAGASLGLTIGGAALGVTSALNTIVTTAIVLEVKCRKKNKASKVFKRFTKDFQSLQGCLEKVIHKQITKMEADKMDVLAEIHKVLKKVKVIRKSIASIVDAGSALKLLNGAGRAVVEEGTALSNVPRAAVKGTLALSKSARAGFIALNALFLGMDIFFICKDSYSLSKGSETEVSQFIRARAALWSSEMDSWKKIHDSLCEGQKTSEEHRAVLDETFYPERAIKKN
ncbi:uncharacterized protein LOC115575643 [Sparus aurata]|uniref:uncharacterized protein LOC115575643 n=1 Tax=Sparus aurata TaxID=8175 RepID=UPI0011C134D8|nr:uncharacterized protein LOC115575643 [Sparus aurata]